MERNESFEVRVTNDACKLRHTFQEGCIEWLSQEGNYDRWLEFGKTSSLISTEIICIVNDDIPEGIGITTEEVMCELQNLLSNFKEYVALIKDIVDDSRSNVYFQSEYQRRVSIYSPMSDTMLDRFRCLE